MAKGGKGKRGNSRGKSKDARAALAGVKGSKSPVKRTLRGATDRAKKYGYKRNKHAVDCVKAMSLLVRGNPTYTLRRAMVHGLVQIPRVRKAKGVYSPLKLTPSKRGRFVSRVRRERTRSRNAVVMKNGQEIGKFTAPHGLFVSKSASASRNMVARQFKAKPKPDAAIADAVDAADKAAAAHAAVAKSADRLAAVSTPGSGAKKDAVKKGQAARKRKSEAERLLEENIKRAAEGAARKGKK